MRGRIIEQKGAVHLLDQDLIKIGRAEDNDIVLASEHVSRHHAEVRWNGQQYLLYDLGSKNGTLVNGRRLVEPRPLQPGDRITLGDQTVTFDTGEETVTLALAEAFAAKALRVDADTAEVWVRGQQVNVTAKEFLALSLLYTKRGALVTKEDLARHVWPEYQGAVGDENIEQLISRLRRKIEQDPEHPSHLITVRGLGYRLLVS